MTRHEGDLGSNILKAASFPIKFLGALALRKQLLSCKQPRFDPKVRDHVELSGTAIYDNPCMKIFTFWSSRGRVIVSKESSHRKDRLGNFQTSAPQGIAFSQR
jgi:hypothetical protein